MYVADAVSRVYLEDEFKEMKLVAEIELQVNALVTSLPISDEKLCELRSEYERDQVMTRGPWALTLC